MPARRSPNGRFRRKTADETQRDAGRQRERWTARIARAQEIRARWEQDYGVETGELYFLGKHQTGDVAEYFNHFAATLKTMRPNMFFQSPKFYVRPRPGLKPPTHEHRAAIGEGVLEAIARQDDHLVKVGKLAVTQAFFRLGVLKTIYDPRMEPNPKKGQPIMQVSADGEPVIDPETGAAVPERNPMTGEVLVEPDELMTDETYRWAWVDAANMLLPDEGPDPLKWTWLGEEVVVPLDVAKEDTRFPASVRASLRSNMTRRERRRPAPTPRDGQPDEQFKYVECYDLRRKRWIVWADGQDTPELLLDEPIPTWIDNDPYALLVLGEPILGPEPSPWPVPVVRDWIPIQDEYNIRRRQITQGSKRSARKVIYYEGTFGDEEEARKALQSPDDMEAVKVAARNLEPTVLVDRDLNPAIYKDVGLLLNDWRTVTGQPGSRLSTSEGDTATEATLVERAAELRDADPQAAVIGWLATAGRKMLQCVKDTLTLDLWVSMREMADKEFQDYAQRVYGLPPELLRALPTLKESVRDRIGQQKWLRVTREALQWEADVVVAPGSTRPRNLDTERRVFMQFMDILGRAPQLALSRELMGRVAKMFEMEDDRLLDELTALAEKMVQISAHQAGRNQGGGANGSANGTTADPALLAAVTGGAR